MQTVETDVLILGAGASGLMCAIAAGRRGRRVIVLDHNEHAGAKVRISGGGRCNCTNLDVQPGHYVSRNPKFCASALARFTPQDFLDMLARHHIDWHLENDTHVFCNGGARLVVEMLCAEAAAAQAELRLAREIGAVHHDSLFTVATNHETYRAEALVIASGGLSYPQIGATGIGHTIARQFGLKMTETRPGLAGFVLGPADKAFTALAGITVDAAGACGGAEFRGNLLFTHRGISGPLALQLSLYWTPHAPLTINLLPDKDVNELIPSARTGNATVRSVLHTVLPRRLVDCLADERLLATRPAQCSKADMAALCVAVHARPIVPTRTDGYATAEVTIGGIDTRGLSSKTMASRDMPGLYCIGEAVDVTGWLGGYNLHWAWASGHVAGEQA